jgi:hypothetical protein
MFKKGLLHDDSYTLPAQHSGGKRLFLQRSLSHCKNLLMTPPTLFKHSERDGKLNLAIKISKDIFQSILGNCITFGILSIFDFC